MLDERIAENLRLSYELMMTEKKLKKAQAENKEIKELKQKLQELLGIQSDTNTPVKKPNLRVLKQRTRIKNER